MDPAKKDLWVTALRSGQYLQGTGVLHRRTEGNDTYCCLGVLCEVAIKAGVELSTSAHTGCRNDECTACRGNAIHTYGGFDDFLPPKIVEWAGLENGNPVTSEQFDDLVSPATLSYLNDNGKNFSEIADIIERDL
jgi:hypothetical protein